MDGFRADYGELLSDAGERVSVTVVSNDDFLRKEQPT